MEKKQKLLADFDGHQYMDGNSAIASLCDKTGIPTADAYSSADPGL